MKFKKVTIKNIRSYKQQSIKFPEGSLLITGDVGSGKTSVLLAIEYALFGLQPGQKGSSLLRINESSGEVTLEFQVGGREIIVERKLKRSLKGISNEYASVTIDGEKTESSITEIKAKIVDLIGYPTELIKRNNALYRYTVYSPQEQMKQIILEDAETRLNILRHIFGIDKYKRIRENLSVLLNTLRAEIKFLQIEVRTIEQDREDIARKERDIQEHTGKIKEKETELNRKIVEREAFERELTTLNEKLEERRIFEQELEKTGIMILAKREGITTITKEYDEIKRSITGQSERFDKNDYNTLLTTLALTHTEYEEVTTDHLTTTSKLKALEKEQHTLNEKRERIFAIDICPTCLQDVSIDHKHNILNEAETQIASIKREYTSFTEEIERISNRKKEIKQMLEKLEEKRNHLEILRTKEEYLEKAAAKLSQLDKQRQTLENDLSILTKHHETLKENISLFSPFDTQHKKKQLEVKNAVLAEKNTEIELAERKKELEFTHRELSRVQQALFKKEIMKKNLADRTNLYTWLSTNFLNLIEFTERNVLLKLRNEFSHLFRKWFLMLIAENTLDTHIDENFTPIILQGEAELDYQFLSGGERTAVALAYRLALNQTINSVLSRLKTQSIIILDEPTDGFSETQIDKMRDILEELNAEQLIIVSHEQKIEGFVDNIIRISKEGNTSRLDTKI